MSSPHPAHRARIKCTDHNRNVSYVHHANGWQCTLANGIPAALSYAGVRPNQEMACKFALQECQNPSQVLATMKRCGAPNYTYELEGVVEPPISQRLADVLLEARAQGYAVVMFNPEEVEGVDVTHLEEHMVQAGNEFIHETKGEDE